MIRIREIGDGGGINSQEIDKPFKKVEPLTKSNPTRPVKSEAPEIITGPGGDTTEISPEARKLSEGKNPKKDN